MGSDEGVDSVEEVNEWVKNILSQAKNPHPRPLPTTPRTSSLGEGRCIACSSSKKYKNDMYASSYAQLTQYARELRKK